VAFLRSRWLRMRRSLGDEVAARLDTALAGHASRETEALERIAVLGEQVTALLAQMSDVFKELGLISEANGELRRAVDDMDRRLTGKLADLGDTVDSSLEVDNQSTELLGRLLASARARLDALEEAAEHLP
jgi:hypothetical protein